MRNITLFSVYLVLLALPGYSYADGTGGAVMSLLFRLYVIAVLVTAITAAFTKSPIYIGVSIVVALGGLGAAFLGKGYSSLSFVAFSIGLVVFAVYTLINVIGWFHRNL